MGEGKSRREFLRYGAGGGLLLMTGGLAAACGSDDTKSAATGEIAGDVRFLKGPNWAGDLKWQRETARAFTAEHPGISVEPNLYDWASVETQLTTAFAGNAPPDIVYMADTLWPRFADAGALLDLTEYVDDPAFAEEKGKYPAEAWEAVTYDGKIFGVPLIQGVISVLYVNTDLMKRAGVTDAVSSYEAMREAARATRKGDVFGYGMATTHNDFSYRRADVGVAKVRAAAAWVRAFDAAVEVTEVSQRLAGSADARSVAEEADAVVLVADTPPYEIGRWVNEACIAYRTPLIVAGQLPPVIKLGPTYVPGAGACFACHETALRRASPLYDDYVSWRGATPMTAGTLGPASAVIGGLIGMELLHLLAGTRPATQDAALILDLRTVQVRREPIPRDPDCVACKHLG